MFYVGLMVTIKQNPIEDTQKIKKSMHTTQKNHQIIKEENKRGRQEHRTIKKPKNKKKNTLENNKITVSTCLSILPLNVNGPSAPIKRHTVAEWIKTR